eukprot:gene8768-biopygen1625
MACDPWSAASCDVLSACRSRTAASRSRAAASRSPTANPGKLTGLNRGEQLAAQPRTLLPPRGSARGRGGGVRSPARRWEGGFFGPLTGGDPCGGRGHPAQDDLSRPTLRRARMCVVHATARGPSGGEYRVVWILEVDEWRDFIPGRPVVVVVGTGGTDRHAPACPGRNARTGACGWATRGGQQAG